MTEMVKLPKQLLGALAAVLAATTSMLGTQITAAQPPATQQVKAVTKTAEQAKIAITALNPTVITADTKEVTVTARIQAGKNNLSGLALNIAVAYQSTLDISQFAEWIRPDGLSQQPYLFLVDSRTVPDIRATTSSEIEIKVPVSALPLAAANEWGGRALRITLTGNGLDEDGISDNSLMLLATEERVSPTPLLAALPITPNGTEMANTLAKTTLKSADAAEPEAQTQTTSTPETVLTALSRGRAGMLYIIDDALVATESVYRDHDWPLQTPKNVNTTAATQMRAAQKAGADITLGGTGLPDATTLATANPRALSESLKASSILAETADIQLAPIVMPKWNSKTAATIEQAAAGAYTTKPLKIVASCPEDENLTYHPAAISADSEILCANEELSRALSSTSKTLGADLDNTQLAGAILAIITRERPYDPRATGANITTTRAEISAARTAAVLEMPWVKGVALKDLSGLNRNDSGIEPESSSIEPDPKISSDLAEIQRLQEQITDASPNPEAVSAPLSQLALLRATRVTDSTRTDAIASATKRTIDQVGNGLTVSAPRQMNLISANTEIPVPVSNQLGVPVQIHVWAQPQDSRLSADKPAKIQLAPYSSATARIPIKAVGNGNLRVKVLITTPKGDQIGQTSTIDLLVRAHWEDRAFTVLAILVTVVFTVGLVRAWRRKSRAGQQSEAGGAPAGETAKGVSNADR